MIKLTEIKLNLLSLVCEVVLTTLESAQTSPITLAEKWVTAAQLLKLKPNLPGLEIASPSELNYSTSPTFDLICHTLASQMPEQAWEVLLEQIHQRLKPDGFCLLDVAMLHTAVTAADLDQPYALWATRFTKLSQRGFSYYRHHQSFILLQKVKINILYLAPWVTWGGSDKGTVDWFRHINKKQFCPYLITTQPSENALLSQVEPYAEEVWNLPDLIPGFQMPQFIMDFIASRNIHMLHIMNSRLAFDMLPTLKMRFPHLRITIQSHAEEEDRSGYCRYITKRYNNLIDCYSVTSHNLKRLMLDYDVSPSKFRVIYTGIEANREFNPAIIADKPGFVEQHKLDLPGLHVLFPARLVEQKDPMLMLEVALRLKALNSSCIIHVVGEGHLQEKMQEFINLNNLQDRVLLHGPSREMPLWYKHTAVTLLTSRFEGIPYVMFEAMAMGCTVVVSDVGANHELLDKTTGFLVTDRLNCEAYVQPLLRLEQQPELLKAIGQAARQKMLTQFPIERMVLEHEALYHELNGVYLAQLAKL